MATTIVMPKQGQSVESCIIVEWKKQVGDEIAIDEALCDVETDKTTMEVPSSVAGTLLAILFKAGDEVPVLAPIAIIGSTSEVLADDRMPERQADKPSEESRQVEPSFAPTARQNPKLVLEGSKIQTPPLSPRARHLAERKQIETATLVGSGPGGRIIERDIQAAIAAQPKLTPVAKAMAAEGGYALPPQGTGLGGRITAKDLQPAATSLPLPLETELETDTEIIPLKGVRKVVAERMLASLQTTAQLTLHMSADARALRAYRERLKQSSEAWGLRAISINDLLLMAVAHTLPAFAFLNATLADNKITQYKAVHLGFAVDTPRGLLVPVIRHADRLTLKEIATESKRLAAACQMGKISADELNGATFTLSNLGGLGIELFTPLLNPPQVAILGVGAITLKAVETADGIFHYPHLNLSLTINHQVVDGAPAARFLQALAQAVAQIDLLLAW